MPLLTASFTRAGLRLRHCGLHRVTPIDLGGLRSQQPLRLVERQLPNAVLQMKRLFLIALPALLASTPVLAQVDPKIAAQCKDARDFIGCVKAFTTPAVDTENDLTALRSAMKQVAARLRSGTSLNDSTSTFRPVVDELALVESSYSDSLAVQKANFASSLFDSLQSAWRDRIYARSSLPPVDGYPLYNCDILQRSANDFNAIYGSPVINWSFKKGWAGLSSCMIKGNNFPDTQMYRVVIRILSEGSISPAEIAEREKAEKERITKIEREQELCALGPWNRYLEENPNMKTWVSANPKAAAKAKEKYINDPKNKTDCRVGLERIYD